MIKMEDETFLMIDPHGFRKGWAMWPINFDPTWVVCTLPRNVEELSAILERHPKVKQEAIGFSNS